MTLAPGSLHDVAGLRVGHHTLSGRPTGCTVVLCPPDGATAGVAVRGGAPGTRETDLLAPGNSIQRVHAVLLTGGSAFGLDAAGGVMRWLETQGRGIEVGPVRVPIVPAAVLFDLWTGDGAIRPDADAGLAACVAAATADADAVLEQGSVGAGAGATVGKWLGFDRAMRGGIGTASVRSASGATVAALVACNAVGDVWYPNGEPMAGARADAQSLQLTPIDQALQRGEPNHTPIRGSATTIGVVATDARLNKTQAGKLAELAHHGLSRAISPITLHDGDTLFGLATGTHEGEHDLSTLGALAALATAAAVRNAVQAAQTLKRAGLPYLPAWQALQTR